MRTYNTDLSSTELPIFSRLNESKFNYRKINGTLTDPDDFFGDSVFTIEEQVVIGALATVAFLSILAIVLRLFMPMFRRTKQTVIETECKYTEQVIAKEKRYGQLPYKASSSSNSSQSSSWSSNSQLDYSDSSSNKTKSTYYTTKSKDTSLPSSYGNFRGSSSSLPVSFSDERSNRSKASSYMKYLNEEPVFVVNKKSLETLKLDEAYRNRWDEEFDPMQLTPSGSLSSFSHPSEDRNFKQRATDIYYHNKFSTKTNIPTNESGYSRKDPVQDIKVNRSMPTQSYRM